jgi:hypothetical protein
MTNNIYQKLQSLQTNIGQLTKTEENKFQKYKYATEQDILKLLRPLLKEHNLILTFSDLPETFTSEKVEKEWIVKYCKKVVLINSENPTEQLTYHFWAPGQNTDIAKAKGSAETYAIKYFLLKFLLIPTAENLDPDSK